jgi:transposase, IS5 family
MTIPKADRQRFALAREANGGEIQNKAFIDVDTHGCPVNQQVCTAVNVRNLSVVEQLLHGKEQKVFPDSGYRSDKKHC